MYGKQLVRWKISSQTFSPGPNSPDWCDCKSIRLPDLMWPDDDDHQSDEKTSCGQHKSPSDVIKLGDWLKKDKQIISIICLNFHAATWIHIMLLHVLLTRWYRWRAGATFQNMDIQRYGCSFFSLKLGVFEASGSSSTFKNVCPKWCFSLPVSTL